MKKRVAVLVSGGGTNLQAMIADASAGRMPHADLALVVSSKADAMALEHAKGANIPTAVLARADFSDAEDFDAALVKLLLAHKIDVVVLAGFLPILRERMLDAYSNRIVNVHPSLIPAFCGTGMYGLRVHQAALARGVQITGATVHLVNDIVDGGRILRQQAVAVEPGDTPETLQLRVMQQAEWILLPQAVEQLCAGEFDCEVSSNG